MCFYYNRRLKTYHSINYGKVNIIAIKIDYINNLNQGFILLMKISHDGKQIGSIAYNYWVNNSITDGCIVHNNNLLLNKKNNKVKKKK
jgi:hypothetical protein